MKLLLDTHIWLWSALEPGRLTARVAEALGSSSNELWVSPISSWEIVLLARKGRIELTCEAVAWIRESMDRAGLREAPLTNAVVLEGCTLPLPHDDPADRFLAATARVYDLVLATADRRLLGLAGIETLANR